MIEQTDCFTSSRRNLALTILPLDATPSHVNAVVHIYYCTLHNELSSDIVCQIGNLHFESDDPGSNSSDARLHFDVVSSNAIESRMRNVDEVAFFELVVRRQVEQDKVLAQPLEFVHHS